MSVSGRSIVLGAAAGGLGGGLAVGLTLALGSPLGAVLGVLAAALAGAAAAWLSGQAASRWALESLSRVDLGEAAPAAGRSHAPRDFESLVADIAEALEKARQLEHEFGKTERAARCFLGAAGGGGAIRGDVAQTEVVSRLPGLLERLRQTAAAIHRDASSLDELNERVASGAADQNDAVSRTASAVEALSDKIDRISINADEAVKACEQVREEARKGLEQVHTVIEGMDRLLAQIEGSGRKTRRLEDRSEEIGVIVEMIRGISSRTDMLALNATIESVRAGEHGRGFAVVAEEIRKLSERTATATREIGTIVEAIQVDTRESITALGQSQSEMQRESERIRGTGSALDLISQVAERSARLVEGISKSTNDQVVATQDLVRAMQRISEVTHQTKERTGQSRTALKGLVQACEPWQQLAATPPEAEAPTSMPPAVRDTPSSLVNPLTRRRRELAGSENGR